MFNAETAPSLGGKNGWQNARTILDGGKEVAKAERPPLRVAVTC